MVQNIFQIGHHQNTLLRINEIEKASRFRCLFDVDFSEISCGCEIIIFGNCEIFRFREK